MRGAARGEEKGGNEAEEGEATKFLRHGAP
jgi:hypothetical protein